MEIEHDAIIALTLLNLYDFFAYEHFIHSVTLFSPIWYFYASHAEFLSLLDAINIFCLLSVA